MSGIGSGARVGILGGTLDPIHVGHLETARAAQRALNLTSIVVMPSRIPPHRVQGPAASVFHRFAMAALAVRSLDRARVCDDELQAEGPSFTAVTLERLAQRGLNPAQMFFITGADAFAEIETWYRYPHVLELAHFVVIARPGTSAAAAAAQLPGIPERVRGVTDDVATPAVFLVEASTPDVSSTDIRRRLRAGEQITGLVPPDVEAHILRHRLYMDPLRGSASNED